MITFLRHDGFEKEIAALEKRRLRYLHPRMWFAQSGAIIAFLCISSHIDNYKDSEMHRLALSRISDLL